MRLRLVSFVLLALLALIVFYVLNQSDNDCAWPVLHDHGTTEALSYPALLSIPGQTALIWRSPTAMVYTPLQAPTEAKNILDYPDLSPQRWQVVQATNGQYHLVWWDADGHLYNALLDSDGQTLRGPIDLGTEVGRDFVTLPYGTGRLRLLWIDEKTSGLFVRDIDYAGRSRPPVALLSTGVQTFAAAADSAGTNHLAWLSQDTGGGWLIQYQSAPELNANTLPAPYTLMTFKLDDSLTSFSMGLDQTHVYLFWSTSSPAQPDIERFHVLTFPLDTPEAVTLAELRLPQHADCTDASFTSELHTGQLAPLNASPVSPAALRWLNPAPGQYTILPVAVTLRTKDGWRPAVVYYRGGSALGFQIAACRAADAGPPAIIVAPDGDLILAWTGLEDAIPHLYTAQTGGIDS